MMPLAAQGYIKDFSVIDDISEEEHIAEMLQEFWALF